MQTSSAFTAQEQQADIPEQLNEFAQQLAKTHIVRSGSSRSSELLKHLNNWKQTLNAAYAYFRAERPRDVNTSRAGEWILDNYYVARQAFRQIEQDLSPGFFHQLPKLDGTLLNGSPRIFAIAWEWVSYSQSQIDLAQTAIFLQAYQQTTPLVIGELWAFPIMLRMAILERLAAAAATLAGLEPPQGRIHLSNPVTAATQASEAVIANCFLSLRLFSGTDWKAFFEQTSRVEHVLRADPAGIYDGMDFETRNQYRNVVEQLAKHSEYDEEAIAQVAIELARQSQDSIRGRRMHVGFFLLDAGIAELEKSIRFKPGMRMKLHRSILAHPTLLYIGSITTLTAVLVLGLLLYAQFSGASPLQLWIAFIFGLGWALEFAITAVHWDVTHAIQPRSLPRMDFSKGIPEGNRTMVVVPTLLENDHELNHLLQELELYFLANRDPLLTYALLTDFSDAPVQSMPEDELLLSKARSGVESLNQKYPDTRPFYLFHRQREWNPSEGVWMGWERKRGKLAQFNRMLLDHGETSYIVHDGDLNILPEIKYVITLDADTSLPQNSASRLIATLAHPLNQAEFAADGRSVIAGYTVLQPRVAIKPTSANRSRFSQIFSGSIGFDLYAFAVSDVYQDLFGEGSYVGKGIYDVKAFERSLAGMVRENTLLSHDLFEGIYGRAALVTDVTLYEEYPSGYLVYARRLRRWIRGDWQLLPWLSPIVHTENGLMPNRLSIISRWKILDNLRRSLLAPDLVALLAAGWLMLPGSPLVWTTLVLLPSFLPIAIQAFEYLLRNLGRLSIRQIFEPARLPLQRWALGIVFLPYEALIMLASIATTLRRLLIARTHLLQWTTAARASRTWGSTLRHEIWWQMSAPVLVSIALAACLAIFNPGALQAATPLLIAWIVSPEVAYWISQPLRHIAPPLSKMQRRQVSRLARRTWAFFERFAGPEDHWLPPDHFQSLPLGRVAHYTTPTNIGMLLLSTLSAYDLGFIGLLELVVRLRSTFENVEKLEHYRGHLLNWYDSQTMLPLPPRYVSTVDSGNLAACLIALKQGCLALQSAPLLDGKQWQGLLAILDILREILQQYGKESATASIGAFELQLAGIYERIESIRDRPELWITTLAWLAQEMEQDVARELLELLQDPIDMEAKSLSELKLYFDLMQHHMQDMQRNISLFAPWLSRLPELPVQLAQTPAWLIFRDSLPAHVPALAEAASVYDAIKTQLEDLHTHLQDNAACAWCQQLEVDLSSARMAVTPLLIGFHDLAEQAEAMVTAMEFRFLLDDQRQVFHIGYSADTQRLDPSYYDLLASEARIASLIAIAKGDVPSSHWQHLGRPVTSVDGSPVLLSWSGTMFEYLMPTLFTRSYAGTFLTDSCEAALGAQIRYGQKLRVPWGISESGYYAFDVNMNYQYRAFGVPDLGYKRDLPEDLVVTPYASILGLSLEPRAVVENLTRLEQLGMLGRFGYYEAIDYTQTRLPPDQKHAIVLSYMAHHQGMILIAACNYLASNQVVERFHADERIQSVELLLQEKIPQHPPIEFPHPDEPVELQQGERSVDSAPWRVPTDGQIPQVHVLSQGDTSTLISSAGGGYTQWCDMALTRWQADSTLDDWGTWIYVQDIESGACWSVTCQPRGCAGGNQEVMFYPHKVEFRRSDEGISVRTEIAVGNEGIEIRRVTVLNDSDRSRRLRLLSYGEVVLAPQMADRRHPAFNKLFIESEYLSRPNALLFHRRPRSEEEKPIYLAHALITETGRKLSREHESDRAQFLGRYGTVRNPLVIMEPRKSLSGTVGKTLDPIFSLAQEMELKPHTRARISFLTVARASRQEVLDILTRHQAPGEIVRAMDLARARSERGLIELGLSVGTVENIQRLLSALFYPVGSVRARPDIIARNQKGQSGLWAFGISGDHPILLVRVHDGDSPLLLEALQAYAYWRDRHITVNLVILNEQETGYGLDLHNSVMRKISRMGMEARLNARDGIFVLRADQIQQADRLLLEAVAGVILDEKDGSLAEHARRLIDRPARLPVFSPSLSSGRDPEPTPPTENAADMPSENSLGKFSQDGREYIIRLKPGQHTPHPWINVIANPEFGFLVSEGGGGCTWAVNSGENRLTPWRNDPVTDMPGEAIYLRDEETGLVWSPTPMPAGAGVVHVIHHGAGYSTFESQSHGLNHKLRLFAAVDAPVKIAHVRLENLWKRPRRITITYYAEWVLGTTRDVHQPYIVPEFEPESQALLAINRFNVEFGERVAFMAASKKPHGVTADRSEFLGRTGSLRHPEALGRIGLAGAVQAGQDPCAAIQLHVDLAPGQVEELYFLLGEGRSREESLDLIRRYQAAEQVEAAWQAIHRQWDEILAAVQVETPDRNMDFMLNRWMLYQTISCRLWGRTALYQSSGAFGFRDQLQDVMALLHSRPELARQHILLAASHQFEEGDVLHWWNPPADRGVRTRFSDDMLWLPFVTAEYVRVTGDSSILNEQVPFLHAEPLRTGEDERYAQFETASRGYKLYEHCRRAIEKGSTSGSHGLPLIGGGDWNDGMNRVGIKGQGESVWLGWFLHATLKRFAALCTVMNDDPGRYEAAADRLGRALEEHAWDGAWYLRAFYDDGSPLGSSQNNECKIDSIAQSWAVISRAAQPERAAQAMESVQQFLVRQPDQLVLLFSPPLDKTPRDPGYIKGYPPGVRENGGQYTHAAIWAVWAFAELGRGELAHAIFNLLNPMSHADTPEKSGRYLVEPYVIAADVYSMPPHTGQGGWTWYTGSAAWMYRLGLEAILGLERAGEGLIVNPCIPAHWPGFKVHYKHGTALYQISVENPQHINRGIQKVLLDGILRPEKSIPLHDDGREHQVQVIMG